MTMKKNVNDRIDALLQIVSHIPIEPDSLKKACFSGIPDESNLRPLCWRVLLGYLPLNKKEWPDYLEKQRQFYDSLIFDVLITKRSEENGKAADHPLNSCPTSTWTKYFQDNEVVAQINRDVRRLCPEISFFQMATDYPCKLLKDLNMEPLCRRVNNVLLESEVLVKNRSGATNLVNSRKLAVEEYACLSDGQEAHWQVVERILFVYAKLNPGVKYVQGMNEILGPIYYVFASDADNEWKKYAEADTFFCFQNLMSEIRDNFIRTMDDSSLGIEFRMKTLFEKLRLKDEKLYDRLTSDQQLLPQYFAFRWISLMLSQEFLLPDVIRIWDSIFCCDRKLDFLIDVCLQMILNVREKMMLNDFSGNMRLLQNYPPVDISCLLWKAKAEY